MMKRTEMVANLAVMVAGIGVSALSKNKTFQRYLKAGEAAAKEVSRQIANEKILREKESSSIKYWKEWLLTNSLTATRQISLPYGEFFLMEMAMRDVHGGTPKLAVGKYFSDDGEHFLAYEKFIADGKLFIFISSVEDKTLYNGGDERIRSFQRICQSGENYNGDLYIFNVEDVEKESSLSEFGEELVSRWKEEHRKDAAEQNTPEKETA